nr:hypothetical protein [Pluralibacter gergoviae]
MPSLAPMLEKVMPSVVSINVEGSTTVNTPRLPRNFQQFFGDNSPFCQDGSPFQSSPFCQQGGGPGGDDSAQKQKFMALGSGVIIDAAKGYVVTNNHVWIMPPQSKSLSATAASSTPKWWAKIRAPILR